MQQFTVPQFIENEDRIIGSITVRQFLLMLAGGFLLVFFYSILNMGAFIVAAIIDAGITAVVAFYEPNGRPFHYFILSFLQTLQRPSLRIWNKEQTIADIKAIHKALENAPLPKPEFVKKEPLGASHLASLALMVDTGGVYEEQS
ncbi:PrgI family protein [Candidatus Uhrbacteria bacterium]|nr:PrgI family protein [Candidatus Uhrbacteria bacterium]